MKSENLLFSKKFNCPLCERGFTSLKVKSASLTKIKDDTDFCPYYKEINPLFYYIAVCPFCGYSYSYENTAELHKEQKEILKEKVTTNWRRKEYSNERSLQDAIDSYRLALYCGQYSGLTSGSIAILSLRLAWLYRFEENKKKEEQFLQYANERFEEAYYQESLPIGHLKEDALLYLLGEINRRLKNYREAIHWFNRQIQLPKEQNRPFIERRTREQWSLTQEERKRRKK